MPEKAFASKGRTSQSATFEHDPVADCIRQRTAAFQGLGLPYETHIEELQAVKYAVSEEFRPHFDWWAEADNPRISTFFAYLACHSGNHTAPGPCRGGGTQFPNYIKPVPSEWCDVVDCDEDKGPQGVAFNPILGNAIYWSNVHPNGSYHEGTLHAGMPVKEGVKVGLNIWVHRDRFY